MARFDQLESNYARPSLEEQYAYLTPEMRPGRPIPFNPGSGMISYKVPAQSPRVEASAAEPTAQASEAGKLPAGFKFDEVQTLPGGDRLPAGFAFDEPGFIPKTKRFLEAVTSKTPTGPISGLLQLLRTSGEAPRGQVDLLTEQGISRAIPGIVEGGILAGTGARGLARPIESAARGMVRPGPEPPSSPLPIPEQPQGPLLLTSRLTPQTAQERLVETPPSELTGPLQYRRDVAAQKQRMSAERAPGSVPGPYQEVLTPPAQSGQVPPTPIPMKALQPHMNSIMGVARRNPEVIQLLEAIVPGDVLGKAMSDPGKAAAIASWTQVLERAAKAKFTPVARSSLELATRNLNNNLGTDINLADLLRGL